MVSKVFGKSDRSYNEAVYMLSSRNDILLILGQLQIQKDFNIWLSDLNDASPKFCQNCASNARKEAD